MTKEKFRKICADAGLSGFDPQFDTAFEGVMGALGISPEGSAQDVIAAYCAAYKTRFGRQPIIDPAVARRLKTVVAEIGTEKGCELVRTYLSISNAWYQQKGYDLDTFLRHVNSIDGYRTGNGVSRKDAIAAERTTENPFAKRLR